MDTADQAQLAIYIHWPFCKSKCPYCDFNSHVREQVEQARWRDALLAELAHMAAHTPGRRAGSIFFGGGTPSLMPPATVQALVDAVRAHWATDAGLEVTLEANPTSVEAAKFRDFRAAGVNRVSLGIQSLRDDQLKFLGREHNAGEAMRAIELARTLFDRYSFDLIYARPNQTCSDWKQELGEALQLAGDHLSLYQLTIEENTAFHHAYAQGGFTLPGEEEAEALYRLTESMLAEAGLAAYEVSNYARKGQESRHNLAYWQGRDYVGVGPGAHGRLSLPGRTATQTLKSPERWLQQVERQGHGVELWRAVARQEEAEERLMMGLRLSEGIDFAAFRQQAGFDLRDYVNASRRAFYTDKGLLENDPASLRATLNGRLVLGTLTAELLN